MDNSRVRLKIGPHEFEAEGSEESVKARLMEFRDLISGSPLERTRGGTDAPAPPPAPAPASALAPREKEDTMVSSERPRLRLVVNR